MIDFSKKPENEWQPKPRYYIEIISMKQMKDGKDKFDVFQTEEEELTGATRIILTFKPKKGYEMMTARIDTIGSLFDFD